MLEHGSYTLLLDSCYDREQFPTMEQAMEWTWASTDDEIAAVAFVLKRFFWLRDDGTYEQIRVAQEIAHYHANATTNQRIARERETKRREERTKRGEASKKKHEAPPNQEPGEPVTSNPTPIVPKGDVGKTGKEEAVAAKKEKDAEKREKAKAIIDLLNTISSSHYKHVDSNLIPIMARIDEKYTMEDFQLMLEHRWEAWKGDTKYIRFYQPSTLFRPSKFAGYVEAARRAPVTSTKTKDRSLSDDLNDTSWAD